MSYIHDNDKIVSFNDTITVCIITAVIYSKFD